MCGQTKATTAVNKFFFYFNTDSKQWILIMPKPAKRRKAPAQSATERSVGDMERGQDGKMHVIAARGNGVHYWKRMPPRPAATSKKSKTATRKKPVTAKKSVAASPTRQKPIVINRKTRNQSPSLVKVEDWENYARKKGLLLTIRQLQQLAPGKRLVLLAAIGQGPRKGGFKIGQIVKPEVYWRGNKETFIRGEKGESNELNGIEYESEKGIGPFFKDSFSAGTKGLAVLGSGSDLSMAWSNLKLMPNILITGN